MWQAEKLFLYGSLSDKKSLNGFFSHFLPLSNDAVLFESKSSRRCFVLKL